MSIVIDFHLHYSVVGKMQPWVAEWMQGSHREPLAAYLARYADPAALVGLLDQCGVDYGVVLADVSPITSTVNTADEVAAWCAGQPRLLPFASVNPFMHYNGAAELRRQVTQLGCRGLKLYPSYQQFYPNDALVYPIYAVAQELGIPVMFHTGSSVFKGSRLKYADPIHLDDVAVDFPDLNIVMAHSGRGFFYNAAFFLARLHPNVYMEISGLPPQKLLTYFPEFERNADKLIFGSDWPGMPAIKRNIELIRALPITEATKRKALGENAARLLQL